MEDFSASLGAASLTLLATTLLAAWCHRRPPPPFERPGRPEERTPRARPKSRKVE